MNAKLYFVITIFVITMSLSAFSATKFIETDEKTGGAWERKYGEDGYIFCNVNGPVGTVVDGAEAVKTNDVAKLPKYIEDYKLGGGIQGYVWQKNDNKPKILAMPDGTKNSACWFTGKGDFTVDFPLKRNTTFTMAIYIDDWENGGRKQSLTLKDLKTGDELAKSPDYEQFGVTGKYAVFQVDRSIQLLVHYIPSYANAVVSGVFFHGGGLAVNSSKTKITTTWANIKTK